LEKGGGKGEVAMIEHRMVVPDISGGNLEANKESTETVKGLIPVAHPTSAVLLSQVAGK
jgi:hypothetical protein